MKEVSEKYGANKFAAQVMPEVRFSEIPARSKDLVKSIVQWAKFGGMDEHYLHELQKNLPVLQGMLLEILVQENILRQGYSSSAK